MNWLNTFFILNSFHHKDSGRYPKEFFNETNINRLLIYSIKNNVGYHIIKYLIDNHNNNLDCNTRTSLINAAFKGKSYHDHQKNLISELYDIYPDFIFFKTYRAYERIPSDLDIFIFKKDYQKIILKMKKICLGLILRFFTILV